MNERVTVMVRDCNEKTALNMTTPNDSERSSKRETFFRIQAVSQIQCGALCSCY